jgi:DNA-binding GntR family transcriptional regulator
VQGFDGRRRVPPIPDEGDKWTRHHTTLARKLMKWVSENVEVGEKLPTKATLLRKMECKTTPLDRVLTDLVQDGILDVEKGAKVTYVRRRGARAIGEWVPAHLR